MSSGLLVLAAVLLSAFASNDSIVENEVKSDRVSEWKEHPRDPVPNVFGGKGRRENIGHGFYEQKGTVPSKASWEAFAHYTFLAYQGISIGNARDPYAISPSGQLAIIPEVYFVGAEKFKMKVYDKRGNRFVIREVEPLAIDRFLWANDERSVKVVFKESGKSVSLMVPEVR